MRRDLLTLTGFSATVVITPGFASGHPEVGFGALLAAIGAISLLWWSR